jgi:hypothetical protein
MLHHAFFYQDYEFQDFPAEQPLPEHYSREQHVLEHGWKALQAHPITQTIRLFEIIYQKYPREVAFPDPLNRLMNVAYGAHPLLGAQETLRLSGLIRILQHAESEFEAMTLAADTFARYGFTLKEAAFCAKQAAECAKLAGKPKEVVAAWRTRAKQLRQHAASSSGRHRRS